MTWMFIILGSLILLGLVMLGLTLFIDRGSYYHSTASGVLEFSGAVILIATLIVSATLIPVKYFERRNCGYSADQLGLKHNWDWAAGCFVEISPHKLIKLDQYRAIIKGK